MTNLNTLLLRKAQKLMFESRRDFDALLVKLKVPPHLEETMREAYRKSDDASRILDSLIVRFEVP